MTCSQWADDRHWYPLFLRGSRFRGLFAFERTHELVWHRLQELPHVHGDEQQQLEGGAAALLAIEA